MNEMAFEDREATNKRPDFADLAAFIRARRDRKR